MTDEKKGLVAHTCTYIIGNAKKGLLFVLPIMLTVWLLGFVVTKSGAWYFESTQWMAELVVFDVLGFDPTDGLKVYAAETVFHIGFIAAVIFALFVLAEIIGTKYGNQMALWVERKMETAPVGGLVYKPLKLIAKMLDVDEGDRLIAGVALLWIMDAIGNVNYSAFYIVGDGLAKMQDDGYGPDTIIGVYRGHVPNPSSGNNNLPRKANVILTEVEIGSFAAKTAMLGHGLPDEFQPYVDQHLKELRAAGFQVFDGLRPKRAEPPRPRITLRPVDGLDGIPAE